MISGLFVPDILKGGVIVLVISVLFGFGWSCRGKVDAKKIRKKEAQILAVTNNYESSLRELSISQGNTARVREALIVQTDALVEANVEYSAQRELTRIAGVAAIASATQSHRRALEMARAETRTLREAMRSATVAEACNQAMLEVARE